jgi:predicted methyltransferase
MSPGDLLPGPLITLKVHEALRSAADGGVPSMECSLDLDRSTTTVGLTDTGWNFEGRSFPWLETCRERTIYHWVGEAFQPIARFTTSLIKLVPTEWGPPTFEIDGIKMLPTARISPYEDAEHKVSLIQPRGKVILDTCGGLGYFAGWCLRGQARQILSYEKNPDVIWLRGLNPWSPQSGPEAGDRLRLTQGDIAEQIGTLPDQSVDAILHDPPRFGTAGELYSQVFYNQLARVLRRKGTLFHYTGTPNKLTSGRDVPNEVARRLRHAGFAVELRGDGLLAVNSSRG